MKKLMMMAAVVCAAVLANAASLNWSLAAGSFTMSDGSTKPSGVTCYLLQFDSAAAADTAYSDLAAGTTKLSDYTQVASAATGTGKAAGKISDTVATSSSLTAGATKYYALFVQDGNKFLLSAAVEGKAYETDPDLGAAANFSTAKFSTTADSRTGWSTVSSTPSDVPEPTSGLLLVLGGAMLALRRKQK